MGENIFWGVSCFCGCITAFGCLTFMPGGDWRIGLATLIPFAFLMPYGYAKGYFDDEKPGGGSGGGGGAGQSSVDSGDVAAVVTTVCSD